MFDATEIEYAFAYFLEKGMGKRGGPHDADVFRCGEYRDLGRLLQIFARHFEVRVNRIADDRLQRGGSTGDRLSQAIRSLEAAGTALCARDGKEPEDFHWEIIGDLVSSLAALLDHIEGKAQATAPAR